jgi:hypothetical protein
LTSKCFDISTIEVTVYLCNELWFKMSNDRIFAQDNSSRQRAIISLLRKFSALRSKLAVSITSRNMKMSPFLEVVLLSGFVVCFP